MSVRLLSIVPGKPMHTSTKEFRPQSQRSCYQKTFWGWHTQYTQSRSPFSGPQGPQQASCDPPFWWHGVLCHGDIQIQFCNICRNHTSFSIPFNLAEVTSVSQFSLIMETKIHIDWITFTQLINIWYKKNLQGNWTICIIQVPKEYIRSRSRIWSDHCAKIFVWNSLYLLLSSHQLTWACPCCSIPHQRKPWCCCHDPGSPPW